MFINEHDQRLRIRQLFNVNSISGTSFIVSITSVQILPELLGPLIQGESYSPRVHLSYGSRTHTIRI